MVSAAAFTYKTKHEAENRLDVVRKLEAQIRLEEDTIDLLKADWSLLTQPSRLQKLSEVYQTELNLQPTSARQFVDIGQVPIKPVGIEDATGPGELEANAPTDKTTTGGIAQ
jgi:hypothetical protein